MEITHNQLQLRDLAAVFLLFLAICAVAIVAFIVECVHFSQNNHSGIEGLESRNEQNLTIHTWNVCQQIMELNNIDVNQRMTLNAMV